VSEVGVLLGVSAVPSQQSQPWVQWSWVGSNAGEIFHYTWQHVELSVIAVAVGVLIAAPLALLARRRRRWETPVYLSTGVLFTIPSLALFGLLIPFTGLGQTTAEIGLVSYTLLILARNFVSGLHAVPPEVLDAADGIGFGATARLVRVELPLALPALVAGVRIATVTTIGLATVASAVGAGGGLGFLINEGFQNNFRTEVVVGAVGSVALAALADGLLVAAERLLTPWARRRGGRP
jgi:osmoprotectant transport system permease protein